MMAVAWEIHNPPQQKSPYDFLVIYTCAKKI